MFIDFTDAIDCDDVRMLEPRRRTGFVHELLTKRGAVYRR